MNFSDKTVAVCDHGLFVEFAVTLAKSFGRVLYYSTWESSFPKSNSMLVGKGIPGVERIDSIWPHIDEIDLFVFPDVYFGPLQVQLEKMGKRVWGARMGEELELDRIKAKHIMSGLGIDIGPYKVIVGLDDLRKYLKRNENQFVKISRTRGDFETFHAKTYDLIEPRLDEIEHSLGAKKKHITFVVESAIEDAVEIGFDGYTIDGKFPSIGTWGIEIKDKAFVMRASAYDDFPAGIHSTNEKLAPYFSQVGYRGFFSSELRLTRDGTPYMMDPCTRAGSPPSELYHLMYRNLAEIIWFGSEGKMVEPDLAAQWGAQIVIESPWAEHNWQPVKFKYRDNVKLKDFTVMNGTYYVIPATVAPGVGSVVALGDTMQEAIDNCKEIAEQVKGYGLVIHSDHLDKAKDEFDKLGEYGIKVSERKTKTVPDQVVVDAGSVDVNAITGNKTFLITGAHQLGFMSDRVMVIPGNQSMINPEKALDVTKTPVLTQGQFKKVLEHLHAQ